MKPAFSVIFLTTLIGVGQGLFVALYCSEIFGWVPDHHSAYYVNGAILSIGFLVAGLIASFFHLGRPERAWRAATMWKTSWLSREVIVLPITMLTIFCYAAMHHYGYIATNQSLMSLVIGGIGTIAVFLLFLCTAMIYACIKFLQEWATPLTIINFTLLGLSSGFILGTAFAAWLSLDATRHLSMVSVTMITMALLFKMLSLARNRRIKPKSTIQTAIGIRHDKIKQQAVGFMGGSFNTRAFFHRNPQATVRLVIRMSLVLSFVVPALLVLTGMLTQLWWVFSLAFGVQYLGLLMERWHFFVQARHPQNLYYQTID